MKNKEIRVVFSVKLDGNRETQPTPPIFVKAGPLNVQGINVFEGEEGNEVFVQAFRVREAPFEKYLEEAIKQAIANERKRIADEVEKIEGVDGSELIIRDRILTIINKEE